MFLWLKISFLQKIAEINLYDHLKIKTPSQQCQMMHFHHVHYNPFGVCVMFSNMKVFPQLRLDNVVALFSCFRPLLVTFRGCNDCNLQGNGGLCIVMA